LKVISGWGWTYLVPAAVGVLVLVLRRGYTGLFSPSPRIITLPIMELTHLYRRITHAPPRPRRPD
jgi:hypothetical protein